MKVTVSLLMSLALAGFSCAQEAPADQPQAPAVQNETAAGGEQGPEAGPRPQAPKCPKCGSDLKLPEPPQGFGPRHARGPQGGPPPQDGQDADNADGSSQDQDEDRKARRARRARGPQGGPPPQACPRGGQGADNADDSSRDKGRKAGRRGHRGQRPEGRPSDQQGGAPKVKCGQCGEEVELPKPPQGGPQGPRPGQPEEGAPEPPAGQEPADAQN